ncbi:Putative Malic enzyme [Aspergillus calidoustus]|uniref:Putative Malic enzyme n=1 Tax=Aspergillus calidoustus TaxID=454130 RepID=A0A0U5FXU8_ASPCI|nr:Putative Malic enzyme [Aspergillus calidoustus]
MSKFKHLPRAAHGPIKCPYTGANLLGNSYYNKGSAFPAAERQKFGLHGLLPPNIQTLDEQVARAYEQYASRPGDLAKNTFMASMKAQNQVLFYRLLQTHLKEMFGVIYTPTEADAIQNYSRLFRKPEGCFLNINDSGLESIEASLENFAPRDGGEVDYIVVSDGEQILGIGDQGVGAILISVAKLVITTACAGIHPSRQLPVVLDCGTNTSSTTNCTSASGSRAQQGKNTTTLSIDLCRLRGRSFRMLISTLRTLACKTPNASSTNTAGTSRASTTTSREPGA